MAISYPTPGRGAWTLTGGLLPVKVGSTSKAGYYRAPAASEVAVGALYASNTDRSHDPYVVYLGVRVIQQLVGAVVDGWFGPDTSAKVTAAQTRYSIEADGIVGRQSMRAFLTRTITDIASGAHVPVAYLGGLCLTESTLDPAAVGVNGADHGIAQINLAAHPDMSIEQALDPETALIFTAEDLAMQHQIWVGRTAADPWDIAIAHHNSPKLAKQWAINGFPPIVLGRIFQIEEYVQKVKTAW